MISTMARVEFLIRGGGVGNSATKGEALKGVPNVKENGSKKLLQPLKMLGIKAML